jgi:hypothetical protein
MANVHYSVFILIVFQSIHIVPRTAMVLWFSAVRPRDKLVGINNRLRLLGRWSNGRQMWKSQAEPALRRATARIGWCEVTCTTLLFPASSARNTQKNASCEWRHPCSTRRGYLAEQDRLPAPGGNNEDFEGIYDKVDTDASYVRIVRSGELDI